MNKLVNSVFILLGIFIFFLSLNLASASDFVFANDGSSAVKLSVPITNGAASLDLIYGNGTSFVGLGKDSNHILQTSSTNKLSFNAHGVNSSSMLVISWSNGASAESYVYKVQNFVNSSGVLRVNLVSQDNGNDITLINGSSTYVGHGNIVLTPSIDYTNQIVNFTGSDGTVFNRVYDTQGNYIILPLIGQLPISRYDLNIYSVSGFTIGNVSLLWDIPKLSISNTLLITPQITIDSPINTVYNSTSIVLNARSNEFVNWSYSLNGASNITFVPNTTISAVSGQNTISIFALDNYGSLNSTTISFTVTLPASNNTSTNSGSSTSSSSSSAGSSTTSNNNVNSVNNYSSQTNSAPNSGSALNAKENKSEISSAQNSSSGKNSNGLVIDENLFIIFCVLIGIVVLVLIIFLIVVLVKKNKQPVVENSADTTRNLNQ